jgi:hypothetical protein
MGLAGVPGALELVGDFARRCELEALVGEGGARAVAQKALQRRPVAGPGAHIRVERVALHERAAGPLLWAGRHGSQNARQARVLRFAHRLGHDRDYDDYDHKTNYYYNYDNHNYYYNQDDNNNNHDNYYNQDDNNNYNHYDYYNQNNYYHCDYNDYNYNYNQTNYNYNHYSDYYNNVAAEYMRRPTEFLL